MLTQTVNLASTTTTITGSSPDPSVVGQNYSVSVSVAAVAPGAGVPTGTVHVTDSDGNGCDVTLASGSGSCVLPSSSSGTKTLNAHYQGDAQLRHVERGSGEPHGDAADTTTAVTSNLNPSVFGQDVTFTATVTADAPSTATPIGLIQFKIDGIDFGAQVPVDGSGHAAVHTSALSVGDHSVQAFYVDASNFISSNGTLIPQQHVNVAFSSTTIVSDTPDPTVVGQDHTVAVHVDAVAPASGVPTGTVTVTDSDGNGCSAVLDGAGNGSCDLPSTSAGTKTIDAHYEGDTSFGVSDATSGNHEVDAADTTTTVATDLNPAVLGQSVTFTATVSANAPSFNVPTGSVQFVVDGGNSGSPVSLDGNGQATLTTSSLGVGSHTVDAHFVGTADYNQLDRFTLARPGGHDGGDDDLDHLGHAGPVGDGPVGDGRLLRDGEPAGHGHAGRQRDGDRRRQRCELHGDGGGRLVPAHAVAGGHAPPDGGVRGRRQLRCVDEPGGDPHGDPGLDHRDDHLGRPRPVGRGPVRAGQLHGERRGPGQRHADGPRGRHRRRQLGGLHLDGRRRPVQPDHHDAGHAPPARPVPR